MFKQPLDGIRPYLVERQIQGFVRSRAAWRGPAFNAPYLNLPSECARASVPVCRHASTHTNRAPTNVFHPLAHGECVVRTRPGSAARPRTAMPRSGGSRQYYHRGRQRRRSAGRCRLRIPLRTTLDSPGTGDLTNQTSAYTRARARTRHTTHHHPQSNSGTHVNLPCI